MAALMATLALPPAPRPLPSLRGWTSPPSAAHAWAMGIAGLPQNVAASTRQANSQRRGSFRPVAASAAPDAPAALPPLTIRRAQTAAELRAAGCLRAAAFSIVPPDRSEYARQSFLRMKADAAWQALEGKVAGTDEQYKHVRVVPLIALVPVESRPPGAEPGFLLPAEPGGSPQLVVGTCDLNQGINLPAEDLIGLLPPGGDVRTLRAYISNVATWQGARRQGVARRLMDETAREATTAGVQHLYVHVEACNTAAAALYLSSGFEVESEEAEGFARAQARNRRLLLHRQL